MVSDAFTKHFDHRLRIMREFVNYQSEPHVIQHAWDAKVFVDEARGLMRLACDFTERFERSAAADKIDDYFAAGYTLRTFLDGVLEICHKTQELVFAAMDEGIDAPGSDELDAAIIKTETLRDRIRSQWPDYDSELAERAKRDFAVGRSRTSTEIVNERRRARSGSGPGTDRVVETAG